MVVLASVLVCFVNAAPESFARKLVSAFVRGERLHKSQLTTNAFSGIASSEGNILLRFRGFDAEDPNAPKGFPAAAYYRCSYMFYPRKAFVGDRTTIINNAADIIDAQFDPDDEWLERNDVRSVVTFEYAPEQGIRFRIDKR